MIIPLMGLLMVGIPMAGFLAGLILLYVSQLRFLAPFAALMPVFSSYGVIIGFWGAAAGLSGFGASDGVAAISGLLIGFIGGALFAWSGYKLAEAACRKLAEHDNARSNGT